MFQDAMQEPTNTPADSVTGQPRGADALPPGDHPLEIAARHGIGPLSPQARAVWHGHAAPCVTCGQLVLRDRSECDHCGQDLSATMLARMRAHAGPWYVLEHVRPFPGVALERIIRQIRRGLITETSIVRGPATQHQWRFAGETPGLCRYFNRCWKCHTYVTDDEGVCGACGARLEFEEHHAPPPGAEPAAAAAAAASPPASVAGGGRAIGRLAELSAALHVAEVPDGGTQEPLPRRGLPVSWLVIVAAAVVGLAVWGIIGLRG
ncbi:MAG: hypothetical protein HY763_04430 [Planctomycetes bacterium]|nr:hypothetical protein [Planctomycetota bacterium]